MSNKYPALGFNFKVTSADSPSALGPVVDLVSKAVGLGGSVDGIDSFQSVSGLGAKMQTDQLTSGGYNNLSYKVPSKIEYDPLTLKRGMLRSSSPLTKWCYDFLGQESFPYSVQRKTLNVFLMDETNPENILMSWSFYDCFPISVKMEDFNSQESKLAIETLELTYSHFKFSN